jgi:hypothetical protein
MIHIFVLTVMLNGNIVSSDMFFRSIHVCQKYAYAVRYNKNRPRHLYGGGSNVTAYCMPKLVNPEKINQPIYDR